eukprot:jgi/Botrbrau1/14817/Bobra.0332s0010.1
MEGSGGRRRGEQGLNPGAKLAIYSALLFVLPLVLLAYFMGGYGDTVLRFFWNPVTQTLRVTLGAVCSIVAILTILVGYVVSAFNEELSVEPLPKRD